MSYILDQDTVIAADLDGTLAESKSPLSTEIAEVLASWLSKRRFAIISGGKFEQFQTQVISRLPIGTKLENLYLFPTNGASCYHFSAGVWEKIYEDNLSESEKETIYTALHSTILKIPFLNSLSRDEIYGEQIEYRGGQITFSALGQLAPLPKKKLWDPNHEKRKLIASHLSPLLPNFTISIGGTNTLDITKKGIDKAYAIHKLMELLNVDQVHIIYLGDALFEGGNDFPVIQTGVTTVSVKNPQDSIQFISSKNS